MKTYRAEGQHLVHTDSGIRAFTATALPEGQDIRRLAALSVACKGLEIPADPSPGILADVVAAARDAATMGPGAGGTFPALEYCLAKLGPAAPSPGSTGGDAGPVSPQAGKPDYMCLAPVPRESDYPASGGARAPQG